MDDDQKLKVGIVGCGYQGGRLASALKLSQGLVLTACMDIDAQAAEELATSLGSVSVYPSLDDLLDQADIDLVMVATPHHTLAEIAIKTIQAGKHVMVEKPIALNDEQAFQIEEALTKSKVICMSGYSFRYLSAWYKVKELLDQGAVGEILAIYGFFGIRALDDGWIAVPKTGGGPLMFIGSHLIDQVLWYVQDEPFEVFADVRYRIDTKADETSAFQIRFANGVTAQLIATQAFTSLFYSLDVYGRQGRLRLNSSGFLDFEITISSNVLEEYKQTVVLHPQAELDPRDFMHVNQFSDLFEAIRIGKQPSPGIVDGRRVLKVIDAIHASSQSGQPVYIA